MKQTVARDEISDSGNDAAFLGLALCAAPIAKESTMRKLPIALAAATALAAGVASLGGARRPRKENDKR